MDTTDTLPPGVDDRRQKPAAAFGWACGWAALWSGGGVNMPKRVFYNISLDL